MKKKTLNQAVEDFRELIVQVRGVPVILDSDLARVYGTTTKALNQAVKRNRDRFPDEFVFPIDWQDAVPNLKSQTVTSSRAPMRSQIVTASEHGGRRKAAYAFTEHGAIMASMVLHSPQAVKMSVFVVRAFVAMRAMLTEQRDLARRLAELERTLTERLDTHEHAISDIIQQIMQLLSPPPEPEVEAPARPRIGFSVQERRAAYQAEKTTGRRSPTRKRDKGSR